MIKIALLIAILTGIFAAAAHSQAAPEEAFRPGDIKHSAPGTEAVPETYKFALPDDCPRAAFGYIRWDLCNVLIEKVQLLHWPSLLPRRRGAELHGG